MQCTLAEIAGWFRCSDDTIERWCKRTYSETFAECFKKYSASGKISLRRNQFRMAEHSPAMAIWLGKQYLGQRDKQEIVAGEIDATVEEMESYFDGRAREEAEGS